MLGAWVIACALAGVLASDARAADSIAAGRFAPPLTATALGPAGHWVQVPRDSLRPPGCTDHAAIVDAGHDRLIIYCTTPTLAPNDVWQMPLGGAPSWHPIVVAGPHPPPRIHAAIAYDPVRERLLMFGGWNGSSYFGDVWALALSGTPAWTQLSPGGTAPPSRAYHTMTYDPIRDRMLIFGGAQTGGTFLQDVWALDLAGGTSWVPLAPAGTPPPARYGHAATYDPVRDRLIIHGGGANFDPFFDMWALSLAGTPTWAQVPMAIGGPQGRRYHAICYDAIHDGLVMFGGDPNAGTYFSDTWTFSFASGAWTFVSSYLDGPGARTEFAAAYDPARAQLLIEGGTESPVATCWAFSLGASTWSKLLPPDDRQSPEGRFAHGAVFDPLRDRMLVQGGVTTGGYFADGTTWALDLRGQPVWSRVDANGVAPQGNHTLVFDPIRDRMLVLDAGAGATMDSIQALSFGPPNAWITMYTSGPHPSRRSAPGAVYDPVRDRVLMFGGWVANFIGGGTGLNDVWQLTLGPAPTWTQLAPQGTPPPGRGFHGMVYDAANDRLVVIGGKATDPSGLGGASLRDVWQLSLAGTPTWQQLAPTGIPPIFLTGVPVVEDAPRHRALVFSGTTIADSVFALSLEAPEGWGYLAPADTPPIPRQYTAAVFDPYNDRLVLFSGGNNSIFEPDTWELRFESPAVTVGPPATGERPRLMGATPNPSSGAMRISFALVGRSPATLELFDPAGRRLAQHEVGSLGPGPHAWSIPEAANLPAGLYLVRLRGPGVDLVARAVHIR